MLPFYWLWVLTTLTTLDAGLVNQRRVMNVMRLKDLNATLSGIPPGSVVWGTIASSAYSTILQEQVFNIQLKVRSGAFFVVLCMDEPCVRFALELGVRAFAASRHWKPSTLDHIKLRGLLELSRLPFPVLFMDLDVMVIRDPLPTLLSPNVGDWDLQIQPDRLEGCLVNIGFFLMHPTPATRQLWADALASLQAKKFRAWDQGLVNDLVCNVSYTRAIGLRLRHLPADSFPQYMLLPTYPAVRNYDAASEHSPLADGAFILHITMVPHPPSCKADVARQLGLWTGARDCYYTAPSRLLHTGDTWDGSETDLQKSLAAALWLARLTGRSLVLPRTVIWRRGPFLKPRTLAWYCIANNSLLPRDVRLLDCNFLQFRARKIGILAPRATPVPLPSRFATAGGAWADVWLANLLNVTTPLLALHRMPRVFDLFPSARQHLLPTTPHHSCID